MIPFIITDTVLSSTTDSPHFRQFKEQQRLSRQSDSSSYSRAEAKVSDPGPASVRPVSGYQAKHSNIDIKSVQKEAVMSYIDRVGHSVPRAGAPPETAPPPPPSHPVLSPRRGPPSTASHLPRAPSTASSSRLTSSQARNSAQPPTAVPSLNFTVRREQVT